MFPPHRCCNTALYGMCNSSSFPFLIPVFRFYHVRTSHFCLGCIGCEDWEERKEEILTQRKKEEKLVPVITTPSEFERYSPFDDGSERLKNTTF